MEKLRSRFVEFVLKIYIKIRVITSPILYRKHYRVSNMDKSAWEEARELTLYKFSEFINDAKKFGYKWDTGKGALDSSFASEEPEYFFSDLNKGRDCDDYARIWRLWGEHQGYTGYEYIIVSPLAPFKTAHVITLLERDGAWWLMNYKPYGHFKSKENALNKMKSWYPYKSGFVAVEYPFKKEKPYKK